MIWLLIGCYSEAAFQRDADIETCAWQEECFEDDFEECLDEADAMWEGPQDPDCVFDAAQAQDCVVSLRRMECPSGEPEFPIACGQVWDCP